MKGTSHIVLMIEVLFYYCIVLGMALQEISGLEENSTLVLDEQGLTRIAQEGTVQVRGCKGMSSLVGGMSAPFTPDFKITAGDYLSNSHTWGGQGAMWRSRIDNPQYCWTPASNNHNAWMQWDFGEKKVVKKIVTKGGGGHGHWMKTFKLSFSDNGHSWKTYLADKELSANTDYESPKENELEPFEARYLRLHPRSWHGRTCVRADVFGCPGDDIPDMVRPCSTDVPLVGKRDRKRIRDEQITASGYHGNSPNHGKGAMWRSRLDGDRGWMVGSANQWIQWQWEEPRTIDGIRTLGDGASNWYVTAYKLQYSDNGYKWEWYWRGAVLPGNSNHRKMQENHLLSFRAKYVRLYPISWSGYPALRADFLGCAPTPEVYKCDEDQTASLVGPMSTPWLPDTKIQSNGYYQNNANYGQNAMWRSRIDNSVGGWAAQSSNKNQWSNGILAKAKLSLRFVSRAMESMVGG
jgi:hypothetical protein